ncbi:MAG: hypothetical protein LBL96_08280 [Clostridiales bacterium]|jgi:hypothetical protein|nr:hypothetical protein [Clostridiales bacterium]
MINVAFLKEQLKRFWLVSALIMFLLLLSCIMPVYVPSRASTAGANYIMSIMAGNNPFLFLISLVAPLCVVLLIFAYQNSSRSTTAINALPLNSRQLFFSNALAGWLLFIIPLAIMSLILLIPVRLTDAEQLGVGFHLYAYKEIFPRGIETGAVINTPLTIFGFFIRAAITFSLYYAIYLTAASITGNGVVTMLISGSLQLFFIGIFIVYQSICSFYVLGYDGSSVMGDLFLKYTTLFHPLGSSFLMTSIPLGTEFVQEAINTQPKSGWLPYWSLWIIYVLLTFAYLGLACYSTTRRKQEHAGDSIVFEPVKSAVIFIASLCGMYLLGIFFIAMFSSEVAMYAGFAIGFTVAYFTSWMIAERTLNVLYKAKDLIKFGGCALALLLIVIGVTRFDLFGFERKIPDISEVKGVINQQHTNYYGDDEGIITATLHDEQILTNEETIKAFMAAHKNIIDDRKTAFRHHIDNMFNTMEQQPGQTTSYETMQFTYLLNDGTSLYRIYSFPYDYYISVGGFDFDAREEVILAPYPTYKRLDLVKEVTIELFDSQEYRVLKSSIDDGSIYGPPLYMNYLTLTNKEHIEGFIEEVKKDIVADHLYSMEQEREGISSNNLPSAELDIYNSSTTKPNVADAYMAVYTRIPIPTKNYNPQTTVSDQAYLNIHDNALSWLIDNGYLEIVE